MRFLGRREGVPSELVEQMRKAEALTANNKRLVLFIAFNYGGRAEILDAAKRFTGDSEEEFRACLYAPGMHDPDIIIRTGSERRLSNYLLWQAAYSELMFRDEPWPDFTRQSLLDCLADADPAVRSAAKQRLEKLIGKPAPIDLTQPQDKLRQAVADLRINYLPPPKPPAPEPTTHPATQPTTQPATQPAA